MTVHQVFILKVTTFPSTTLGLTLTHLDGQGLPLSDDSTQLNHRLHLGNRALDALINQTFPGRKYK